MYKFWVFVVDTIIKFPESVYYFKYKGLEFKYITGYKENKVDTLVIRYSNITDIEAYRLVAEYLNALAFRGNSFLDFDSRTQQNLNAKLNELNFSSDERRSYHSYDIIPDIFFISNITNKEQSQLISLYRQARCNKNPYFQTLFFWHTLVYPSKNDDNAVDFINNNIDKVEKFQFDFIEKNPIFSRNGKINTSFGEYIKNGVRHSIAHIVRDKKRGVSLEQENWEQIRHVATIGAILEDLSRYKIENEYNVKGYPDMNVLARFNPEES